jgi:uncharacterized protein YkwD
MRRLRFTLPTIAAAALALAGTTTTTAVAASPCAGAHSVPNSRNAAVVRHATLCLLNRERARHHLPRLRASKSLRRAARSYSGTMVRHGFFSHVSPSGSTMTTRIKRTRYLRGARRWALGENLAWGSGSQSTPAQIVRAWMHSPGHRANILNGSFREIGIGVVRGAPRRVGASTAAATYTTEFGRRG